MPIYEYRCNNCGKDFETLILRSDEDVKCPECGSEDLSKLMSGSNFNINGVDFSSSSSSSSSAPSCPTGTCGL